MSKECGVCKGRGFVRVSEIFASPTSPMDFRFVDRLEFCSSCITTEPSDSPKNTNLMENK